MTLCAIEDCTRTATRRAAGSEVCNAHYERHRRNGHFGGRALRIYDPDTLPAAPLGEALQRFRKTRGPNLYGEMGKNERWSKWARGEMSTRDLEEVFGCNYSTISNILSGRSKRLTVTKIDRMCCAMGMHPWEVYGDEWLVRTVIDGERFVEVPA